MLRNMEYVYEVYKERSFTRAAKNLYVTQPCLSALVKKTEEKLGFTGRQEGISAYATVLIQRMGS